MRQHKGKLKNGLSVVFTCVVLCLVLVTAAVSLPIAPQYNPWCDINSDGKVDMKDIGSVAKDFGATGTPLTKGSLLYDSGWIDITDKQGQTVLVSHDLNIADWNDPKILVDISGKTKRDGKLLRECSAAFGMPSWNMTLGSQLTEYGMDLVQTGDGGFILATINGTSEDETDILMTKLDSSGSQQWTKTFASQGYDEVRNVIQTSDGGFALAGCKNYYGPGDMWLIKTDASGVEQWNKTYGGPNFDTAVSLIQTNDGGYALAGETGVFYSHYDPYLVKTDADGNFQWSQTYSGGKWSTLWGVVQRSDGGYTLVGIMDWLRVWLIKAGSDGTVIWERIYEGSGDEEPRDFIQTFDGGYAIAGYTTSYGAGGRDGWLVKTDADGNAQWNMTYGRPGTDEFQSIVQTADGGFVLTGREGTSSEDAMLVKTDSNGNVEWNRTYGASNPDFMRSLVLTSDGGVAMIGETQSFGAGGRDVWLIRTCLETGLEQVSASANTVTLYRGPTDPYWNYVRVQIWTQRQNP